MKQSVAGARDHRVIMFENDSGDSTFAAMRVLHAPCRSHPGSRVYLDF